MISIIYSKINFDKIYHYSFLLFAFLLPLARQMNKYFIMLFCIMLLLQGDYKKHYLKLKDSPLARSILLLAGFATLSMLWSTEDYTTYKYVKYYWQWIAIFVIAINVKTNQIHHIITAFLLGMFISELLAYGMFFEFWQIRGHGKEYPSPFMFHISYSVFLAFSAMILLNRVLSQHYSWSEKVPIALFLIAILGNLFINEGRTGQLALLFSIVVATVIHFRFTIKTVFVSLTLIAIIFSSAYGVSEMFQKRVQMAVNDVQKIFEGNFNSSWGTRVAYHYVAADIIEENPIIGVGVGDFKKSAKDALQKDDHGFSSKLKAFIPKYHFHNQYLNVVVQNGLIGLLLLLYMIYNLFTVKIGDSELKELSVLFTTVFVISFFAEPLLIKEYANVLFVLFTGLFLGASLQTKKVDT